MSWDEKLFRASLGLVQTVLRKKEAPEPEEAHQVLLSEVQPRLRTLAVALTGQSIEIKEAETLGGPVAGALFLPARMAVATRRELNLQAYLYRVVYSLVLMELGFVLPEEYKENAPAQILMSLLAVPAARDRLHQKYPGLASVEAELRTSEAHRLARVVPESPRQQALHALSLSLLVDGPAPDWASSAVQEAPATQAALLTATRVVLPSLSRYSPGRREDLYRMAPLIWGLLLPPTTQVTGAQDLGGDAPKAGEGTLPTGTEKKGKPRESVEEVKLGENKDGENPLVHAFEKVKTVDDYIGGKKMLDGSDELEEQLEAIQELDLRKVIRTRERTDSIYKADAMIDGGAADFADVEGQEVPQFLYDEWDYRARQYRKDWCKLYLETRSRSCTPEQAREYVSAALARNARQIRDLRRQFEEFTYVRRWRTRQPDGPEIDIDAVVDRYATVRSGNSGSRFLYLSQRPKERDYATLVLLDSSLSTDSWLENRRVIDVMKESMLVLGEVIAEFQDRMAIGAFYSNTRNDCRFIEVKNFEESWKRCQTKLVGLHPTGYTRIGPALRHGTEMLRKTQAKKKLLLLISDGKPTDYDRYEGRYGIEDIRQAIRDANRDNVIVRALAVDAQAKFYLPQMFGTGNFQILPNPSLLARSLAEVYGWLNV